MTQDNTAAGSAAQNSKKGFRHYLKLSAIFAGVATVLGAGAATYNRFGKTEEITGYVASKSNDGTPLKPEYIITLTDGQRLINEPGIGKSVKETAVLNNRIHSRREYTFYTHGGVFGDPVIDKVALPLAKQGLKHEIDPGLEESDSLQSPLTQTAPAQSPASAARDFAPAAAAPQKRVVFTVGDSVEVQMSVPADAIDRIKIESITPIGPVRIVQPSAPRSNSL